MMWRIPTSTVPQASPPLTPLLPSSKGRLVWICRQRSKRAPSPLNVVDHHSSERIIRPYLLIHGDGTLANPHPALLAPRFGIPPRFPRFPCPSAHSSCPSRAPLARWTTKRRRPANHRIRLIRLHVHQHTLGDEERRDATGVSRPLDCCVERGDVAQVRPDKSIAGRERMKVKVKTRKDTKRHEGRCECGLRTRDTDCG